MTPRGIPALRMLPHMGPATTAPARSVNYIVNHMCEHICEPIQSTGRILPGGPGITMCAENTAYKSTAHAHSLGFSSAAAAANGNYFAISTIWVSANDSGPDIRGFFLFSRTASLVPLFED